MRVGIVLPYLKAGGTERQARYIARYLRDSGHDVTIVVAEAKGIFQERVEVETASLNVPFNKTYAPLLVYRLVRTIQNRGFDLVLSRAWNMNMVAAIAGLMTRTPYVLFLSGPTGREGQSRLKLAIEGILLQRAARIISVSKAAKENCIKAYRLSSSHIQVMHNGIKVDEVQRLSQKPSKDANRISAKDFNIVFVGRITHRKGLDILFQSVQQLDENIKVWVVGGGEIDKYEKLADNLSLKENVYFLGEKENPFPELKRADLFVLPSRSEGFPNVLLEAMALGRAVLATDCETGPSEIINGKNGRLFPVEDAQALTRQIRGLIYNKQKVKEMGAEAQKTVRNNFRLETQLAKIEAALQKAL